MFLSAEASSSAPKQINQVIKTSQQKIKKHWTKQLHVKNRAAGAVNCRAAADHNWRCRCSGWLNFPQRCRPHQNKHTWRLKRWINLLWWMMLPHTVKITRSWKFPSSSDGLSSIVTSKWIKSQPQPWRHVVVVDHVPQANTNTPLPWLQRQVFLVWK